MPVFAIFITKLLFEYQHWDYDVVRDSAKKWCLYMFLVAVAALITGTLQKLMFGILGENIAKKMREELYKSFLSKHQGWFDIRSHSPGSLSSSLATDAQVVNGAATEGVAIQIESTCSLLAGIIIGFYYSWRVSLVCLATVPFMVVASVIQAKFQMGFEDAANDDDEAAMVGNQKIEEQLAGDCIINLRTIASFGQDEFIIKRYSAYMEEGHR